MQEWHTALLDASTAEGDWADTGVPIPNSDRREGNGRAAWRPAQAPSGGGPRGLDLGGVALAAWRSYLQSHATILRDLDAELTATHGVTTRDYQVLLYLAEAPDKQLPMSALADRTMLTRSGITRLVDGLVAAGLIERVCCPDDGRVYYAQLTDAGLETLRTAGDQHIAGIRRLFLERFTPTELEKLASLLSRLPGSC